MERWNSTTFARRSTTGSTMHADELAPDFDGGGTLDEQMAQIAKVRHLTFDAGWIRYGWPERVGGLGGSTLLRAYLAEALTARDLVEAGIYSLTEFLVPTMVDFAAPELAATMVPPLLRGDEIWCQGFSEPGSGSNLASLRAGRWPPTRVAGHWPEGVDEPGAVRPAVCAPDPHGNGRVGSPRHYRALRRHGHAGINGAQPIETMHGEPEFCETFFDDVLVPFDRTLGRSATGWAFAMDAASVRAQHRHSGRRPRSSTAGCRTYSTRPTPGRSIPPSWARWCNSSTRSARGRGPPSTGWRERRIAGRGDVDRQSVPGHGRAGGVRPRGRHAVRAR